MTSLGAPSPLEGDAEAGCEAAGAGDSLEAVVAEGETEAPRLADGETDGETDGDAEAEALGLAEALADAEGVGEGDAERDADGDADGDAVLVPAEV